MTVYDFETPIPEDEPEKVVANRSTRYLELEALPVGAHTLMANPNLRVGNNGVAIAIAYLHKRYPERKYVWRNRDMENTDVWRRR